MGVAETRLRLALARGQMGQEIRVLFDQPHALAAAARRRLDQDGIADGIGL